MMKPWQWMAPTCLAPSRSAPRQRSGAAAALLCLALAGANAVAATSASAAPLASCDPGRAIYQATTDARYEIEFFRDVGETPGPLRYRGRAGLRKYELWTEWTMGLLRPFVMIRESKGRTPSYPFGSQRQPALSSTMMNLAADFSYHQGETAPPYMDLPDPGAAFYQWRTEQARHPGERIIPPDAWKLVRCRGAGALRVLHAGGSGPAATSAAAAPASCKLEQAVYQPVFNEDFFEIEFFRNFEVERNLAKSAVLKYRSPTGLVEYEVLIAWSKGFARPYFFIKSKPDDIQRGVTSVILRFGTDFRPRRSHNSAPPYLVIPELARDFYYWHDEQARHPEEVIPSEIWKLVRCRDER
jgi:hypothetical protein